MAVMVHFWVAVAGNSSFITTQATAPAVIQPLLLNLRFNRTLARSGCLTHSLFNMWTYSTFSHKFKTLCCLNCFNLKKREKKRNKRNKLDFLFLLADHLSSISALHCFYFSDRFLVRRWKLSPRDVNISSHFLKEKQYLQVHCISSLGC